MEGEFIGVRRSWRSCSYVVTFLIFPPSGETPAYPPKVQPFRVYAALALNSHCVLGAACSQEQPRNSLGFQGRGLSLQGRGSGFQGRSFRLQGRGSGLQGRGFGFQGRGLGLQGRSLGFQAGNDSQTDVTMVLCAHKVTSLWCFWHLNSPKHRSNVSS